MRRKGTLYIGLLLIVMGGLFMIIQFTEGLAPRWLGWGRLWPLLVLFVGFAFWLPLLIWWPSRQRIAGLVVPGTIITVNGLLLLYQALSGNWGSWAYLWTLEPLSVGIALLLLYAIGPRSRELLLAARIVSGIGLALLLILSAVFSPLLRFVLPVVLIAAGLLMFLRASRERVQDDAPQQS